MVEDVFGDLKRYVTFGAEDEAALRALHPLVQPRFIESRSASIATSSNRTGRARSCRAARAASGDLKVTPRRLDGQAAARSVGREYFQLRCRIGRVHVRIALPQHYMFGAMNVVRQRARTASSTSTTGGSRERALARTRGRQDPRHRAGDHAAHLPRGSARAAARGTSGSPPSGSSSAPSATSFATRWASSRRRSSS